MLGQTANGPEVWTARRLVEGERDQVLAALTDPDLIARWAPVDFEVEGLAGGRLRGGSREHVSGSIGGLRVSFDIWVVSADEQRLELVGEGPVAFDVHYALTELGERVLVEASVRVRRRGGLATQMLRAAVCALLNAGALGSALRRLEASLAPEPEPVLVPA